MNVFPTWENYISQFDIFADSISENGSLIYFDADEVLNDIAVKQGKRILALPYNALPYENVNGQCIVSWDGKQYPMAVFGDHNLQNMNGARLVCNQLGISDDGFLKAIQTFKGAAKRLQLLEKNEHTSIFLDFAHSPSKLKATTDAVKKQFPNHRLLAVMELHTFSSLNKNFLPQYEKSMEKADSAVVFFNPEVIKHKKLPEISISDVQNAFNQDGLKVVTETQVLIDLLEAA